MDNFYAILGIPPNAASAEIKGRYRFLSHAYHPDKFSSDAHKRDAEEAFKKINEAFQTLSNPSLRADYDRRRANDTANEPKSAPPPPRPASSPSPKAKRPGSIKYAVAAILGSIIGGMFGAFAGPPGILVGVIVGLWFGIWACNREPKPRATPKPARPRPRMWWPQTPRGIVLLIVAAAFGIATLLDYLWAPKPRVPSYEELTAPTQKKGGGFVAPQEGIIQEEFTKETGTGQSEPPWVPPEFAAEREAQKVKTWEPPEVKLRDKPSASPTMANPFDQFDAPAASLKPAFDPDAFLKNHTPPSTDKRSSSETPASATKERSYVNSLGMKFVPVAGTKVLFSVWETRVQDYEVFAKETKREWPKPDYQQGPTHPAVNVGWPDAVAFCEWLSKKEGGTYRLPTDAEWSVAVGLGVERGNTPEDKDGKVAGYPWGKAWPPPRGTGNYGWDNFARTAPVGSFAANAFGLYDLSGNVWEWCEDWYSKKKDYRVLRGGSWGYYEKGFLRSSCRYTDHPTHRDAYYGFRCVLVPSSG